MAEEIIPIPNLSLPQHLFTLISPTLGQLHDNARKQLLEGIKADEMSPYYKLVTSAGAKDNEEELKKLDERVAEAEKQEGDSEANHLSRIGDKEGTIAAQKLALEKTPGLGSRIDVALTLIRLGFFFGDNGLITENLPKAERCASQSFTEGGDWDRRNRLKVFRGLHMISIRQLKAGGALLLHALSTFTTTELTTYLLSATLEQTYLLPSRLLSPHTRYYVREMRILAYSQLLESYRSLTLESLSGVFGVSVEFVDSELSRFIVNGRLHCTIDKVHSIVETTRPSLKNAQYDQAIKQGDDSSLY
ncbi:PCI-domain-containing protein [Suillus placidus]|uniref:PCI-domain-containing protein n=1 Tax=Suillus placidus TaxID=48579 RepID=A0A9P7CY53_9AGAM|nr:PCI-domain-containing protein [Suillus placidus]